MEVQNYEEYYLIYDDGRVQNKKTGRFLKANINTNGYYYVGLCKDGVLKHFKVHRLIAIHYIENSNPNFKIINHKNGDRLDNSIDNLEWCDYLYNNQSKNRTGKNVGYVYFRTNYKSKQYQAQITINRVRHTKCFETEVEALEWITELSNNS